MTYIVLMNNLTKEASTFHLNHLFIFHIMTIANSQSYNKFELLSCNSFLVAIKG